MNNKKEIDRSLTKCFSKSLYLLNIINLNVAQDYFDKKYTPEWSRRRKIIVYGVVFLFGLSVLKLLSR